MVEDYISQEGEYKGVEKTFSLQEKTAITSEVEVLIRQEESLEVLNVEEVLREAELKKVSKFLKTIHLLRNLMITP